MLPAKVKYYLKVSKGAAAFTDTAIFFMKKTIFLFFIFFVSSLFAGNVSRDIPQNFKEYLAPHLATKVPEVSDDADFIKSNDDILILLQENITYMQKDGRLLSIT